MKELSVGMYVRNNHFGIGKINKEYFDSNNKHWFNVQFNCYKDEDCHCGICEETKGFKASHNIIDLIEVGDYVNGREVIDIKMKCDETIKCLITKGYDITNEMIKSIVTKEQFESMKYVVE